ncbi:tyrosine-type recombinase/integrase [Luteolibacter sp. Populi]|uniref:tyrosine-type recombinase/integrase n=1 Tax=Luteolibacter sp. Populi TaxID=3230487 RepID=UPI003464F86A
MPPGTPLFDRNGNRKYLNAFERLRFYEAALLLPDEGEKAFALTVFYTGCRISEALALTPSGVDQAERLLVVKTLKQRGKQKHRAIPIPDVLLSLLHQQTAPLAPDARLWAFCRTKGWKVIKRCMAAAGLDGIKATPKGLRHGYAIACVSADVPLPTLQRWLGHATLQTTGIYLDFVGEDERNIAAKVWSKVLESTGATNKR